MKNNLKDIFYKIKANKSVYEQTVSRFGFDDFLKSYTLHDSYLRMVVADEDNVFSIGILWDTFWNSEKLGLPETETEVDLWPILFISFPTLYQVNWKMYQGDICDTILETQSEKLDTAIAPELQKAIIRLNNVNIDATGISKTRIKCVLGEMEFIHKDPIEFLFVNANGKPVKLEL